jgi:DNA-binding transcriptional ArsR family regulator
MAVDRRTTAGRLDQSVKSLSYGLTVPFTAGRPLAEAKADLFKALAHPARIRVLELLAEQDRTIGELADGIGLELSHLSQQVAVLKRAGLVESHRLRSNVVCTLRHPQTAALLSVAREMISANFRHSGELLAALEGERP